MLSQERLDDLEDLMCDFETEHKDELDAREDALVEAARNNDYDAYVKAWNSMKSFCVAGGEGGRFYFDQMWKNDPVKKRLKEIKDGPQYSDIVAMLKDRGPSESKDIYVLVSGSDYKSLQKLVRKGEVLRIEGSHIYYLPDQNVSGVVADVQKKQESARQIEEQFKDSDPVELTLPSTEEVLGHICETVEEGLRKEGATEEQINQVFGRKKRHGLLSLFKKK